MDFHIYQLILIFFPYVCSKLFFFDNDFLIIFFFIKSDNEIN